MVCLLGPSLPRDVEGPVGHPPETTTPLEVLVPLRVETTVSPPGSLVQDSYCTLLLSSPGVPTQRKFTGL